MPSSKLSEYVFVTISPPRGTWDEIWSIKALDDSYWKCIFTAYYQIIEDGSHTHILGYPNDDWINKKFDDLRDSLKSQFGPFKFPQRALDTKGPNKSQDDIGLLAYMMKGLVDNKHKINNTVVFNIPQEMVDEGLLRAKFLYSKKELLFASISSICLIAWELCDGLIEDNPYNNLQYIKDELLLKGYIFTGNIQQYNTSLEQVIKRFWLKKNSKKRVSG